MLLKLNDGGMGDIVALTGVLREVHRVYPLEPLDVQTGGRCMEVFKNNPHITPNAPGQKIVVLQVERDHGMNIVESFSKQAGVDAVDHTPQILLSQEELDIPKLYRPNSKPVLAIDIWSRAETRRWSWERWAEVTQKLSPFWTIIEIGKRDPDYNLHSVEKRLLPGTFLSMVGKLSIRQSAALLKQCDLFLGMDSGSTHLAAAVGTPQVCLYSRSPWHSRAYWNTTPIFSKQHGCWSKCDRKCVNPMEGPCLDWITPKMVVETVAMARSRHKIAPVTGVKEAAIAAQKRGNGVLAPTVREVVQRSQADNRRPDKKDSVRSDGRAIPVPVTQNLIEGKLRQVRPHQGPDGGRIGRRDGSRKSSRQTANQRVLPRASKLKLR